MNRPMISIVVPVYKAEATLARCVDSILHQSMQDFELILVDDGSPDACPVLCDEYALRDARVRVIHQKNAGVSAARNAGMDGAKGKYLTFADSDDEIMQDHLFHYYEMINREQCDIVIGGYTRISGEKRERIMPDAEGCFGGEIWESICRDSAIYGYLWNKMFQTAFLKENGFRMQERMYSQEDLDFCLSALEKAQRTALIRTNSYCYHYAPSARRPAVWDYLANQIKLLENARACTQLSQEAVESVHARIRLLLYAGLYDAVENDCFEETVQRICSVKGLVPMLKEAGGTGERGFVARCFAAGKHTTIRRYLYVRNRIRDAVRMIRRAGKP